MYTENPYPLTFYHQYSTQLFPNTAYAQPRVGDGNTDRSLLPRSQYFYSFRLPGIILGCLILLFAMSLFSVELGRVYNGLNNRDLNESTFTSAVSSLNSSASNGSNYNRKIENHSVWPWSTATLFFSLIFVTTGIFGIISGLRESYSLLLAFCIFSLLSMSLLVFLIATYSIIISGWKGIFGTNPVYATTNFARNDRDLSVACLSLSCVLFVIHVISTILSGLSVNLCRRKDFLEGAIESDDNANSKSPRFAR